MPPQVAPVGPLDVLLGAAHDEHLLDRRLYALAAVAQRLVDVHLQCRGAALAIPAVGGDHDLRARIVDARAKAVGAESAEDHRVHGAEPSDGEERSDRFGDHRQVHGDAVALTHAELGEHIGQTLDLVGELRVGDRAGVAGFALEVIRDAVTAACLDVTVEAVVGDVELAVAEPLGERRIAPVEHVGERLVPVEELSRLLAPEPHAVGVRVVVDLRTDYRVLRELGRRCESAVLVQKVIDLLRHGLLLCDVLIRGPRARGEDP